MLLNKRRLILFLEQFLVATVLFVVLPAFMLKLKVLQISADNVPQALVVVLFALLYSYYLAAEFFIGAALLVDIVSKNFVSRQLTYVNSVVAKHRFTNHKKSVGTRTSSQTLAVDYYLRVIFGDDTGKRAYSTASLHQMEPGQSYTVIYGKHSKILLSVLNKDGEEMLFDAH